jgi:hypothetical protein
VQVKTKAIVLSSLKFQEKLDCKMFYAVTRFEIVFVRDAFRVGKAIKKSLFPTLTILEIEAVHKKQGTLKFQEIKICFSFHSFGYL